MAERDAGTAIDWRIKSFPAVDRPLGLGAVGRQGWTLFSGRFWFPLMVLKESALAHNLARMARYCEEHGASLAPHGKTTMSPQIIRRQVDAGAWGVTAATVWQARALREFGVRRVLLANEAVEPSALAWIAETLAADPGFELLCYADSVEGAGLLADAMRGLEGRPLPVLIEVGMPGGRTGCRTTAQAVEVARAVMASPSLSVAGVSGFEGVIQGADLAGTLAGVDAFLDRLREAAVALDGLGAFDGGREIVVSVGGSSYFDRVVERLGGGWSLAAPVRLVLRSGCYVTHDHGTYDKVSALGGRDPDPADRLQPALELWGAVVSRPEPGLAYANFGRRDAPFDAGLPMPLKVRGRDGAVRDVAGRVTVTGLNDQHAFLRLPADDPLAVGDLISCGISHPCTAFDKWRALPVVDDEYRVIGAVETVF